MPDTTISPTSYTDVNTILQRLLKNAQTILGDHLIGLYIHGSLASGDFNPQTSDIDFLVVTDADLSAEAFSTLKTMHARLFASGLAWSQKLEGAYLPKEELRRHDPAHDPVPWLEINGVLEDNWPMVNAIQKMEATPSRRYRVDEKKI